MLNEHHNTPTCLGATMNLEAAILARTTKKPKIVLLGNPLPIFDNPIRLAEELAEIDMISRGRLVSGFVRGTGVESLATNTNPLYNRERFEEAHDLIIKTWTTPGPFRWEGTHYHFRVVNPFETPFQKPHPPVIVGGAYPYGARRAIAYGDGWVPHARRPAYGEVLNLLPDFKKMATAAGRDPATIPITIFGVAEDPDLIKRYREAGVARLVFNLPPAQADEVLPLLDRCARLMQS